MPNLVLTTPTNPGDANWVDIDTLVPPGTTVIPSGGTISGAYTSDVFCEGNVTIAGNTVIGGDLIVIGDLRETVPYPLVVNGDLIVRNDVDYSAVMVSQANITVGGDFICSGEIIIPQKGGNSSIILVNGDMTVSGGDINIRPTDENTDGGTLIVEGSLTCRDIRIGGATVPVYDFLGKNAGTLFVGGNATFENVHGFGGIPIIPGNTAGNGVTITVIGTCSGVAVYGNGGNNSNGSAGNGGNAAFGACNLESLYLSGGSCDSSSPNHVAGQGGSININLFSTSNYGHSGIDSVWLDGGRRYGGISGNAIQPAPNAGYASINADFTCREFYARGGNGDTFLGTCQPGGDGGFVGILGTFSVDIFSAKGGDSGLLQGGNGGTLNTGRDTIARTFIGVSGGTSTTLYGGDGGTVSTRSAYGRFESNGGDGANGNGGNGGSIDISSAANGNYFNTSFSANGGDCTSSNPTHGAGRGGTITIGGDCCAFSIYATGGNRSGTLSGSGNGQQNKGGVINIRGSVTFDYLGAFGGSVFVSGGFTHNSATPPNGGTVLVKGSILNTPSYVGLNGGNSNAGNAGNGGTLTASACAGMSSLTALGGNTTYAGATAGGGGFLTVGNLTAASIDLSDGTGAVAPATSGRLYTYGTSSIESLTIAAAGIVRVPAAGDTCLLRLQAMSPKNTLNLVDNSTTTNQAANFATNVYVYNGTSSPGQWLRIAGTAI